MQAFIPRQAVLVPLSQEGVGNLVPAGTVIPALLAYIKVVAVKSS